MIKMKDSGIAWIGEIPNNWSIQRVKHAFTRKNEKAMIESPTVLSLARSGVKVRDISNNEGQIAESYYNYNPVEDGDLLLNPMDLYSGANCSISKVSGVISPAYINLKNKNGYNSRFYDYYFKMQYWMMAFFAHGKGVSFDNRWTLSVETLMNYPIVTPDYDEQCKRAEYLDEKCAKIDAIIEKQQAVIEKLKEYKLSVITETVTKGLNQDVEMKDSEIEWIGKIPIHWTIRRASTLSERIVVGVVIRPSEYFDSNGTIPFLRGMNVKDFKISTKDLVFINEESNKVLNKSIVHEGDILIVRDGNIGASCIVPKELDGSNVVSMIIFTANSECTSNYICYCLNSCVGKNQFEITKIGSALTHTSVSAVSRLIFSTPPIEEQREIVAYLDKKCDAIDKTIESKHTIVEKLIEYKKSLIYEVVTGKKEV